MLERTTPILLPDGSRIRRHIHPFSNSRSANRGKIKYKRIWWRVHRKGTDKEWELKEPLEGEYRVYVLRLKSQIWDSEKLFRERNPDYQSGKPHVYVGHTSKAIEDRVATHLAGGRGSSKFVRKYFRRIMEAEQKTLPIARSRAQALRLEAQTAGDLRSRGWAVWEGRVEDLNLARPTPQPRETE